MDAVKHLQAEFQQLRQAIYSREEKLKKAVELLNKLGHLSLADRQTVVAAIELLEGA
jgi:hypothetical protein